MLKVEQLGFKMKLGKKEYEYSYTDWVVAYYNLIYNTIIFNSW